jgi:polyhydroxybutyrate depolymerase
MVDLTAISAAADERGMITVFPEATDRIWTVLGSPAPTADADFAADVIAEVARTLCIDPHRVYAAGFSLGGSVAQLVGCAHADLVAAVASVASPAVACHGGVPLIAVHGDADPIAPYEGRASSAPGEIALLSVPQAVAEWAGALGCDATAAISQVAADVELAAYGGCGGAGADALLYTVRGGGHAWPGATFDFPREITGFTTHSISANQLLLNFFDSQRH